MGKMKEHYIEYEESLQDYLIMEHEDECLREGSIVFQMSPKEADAYNLYMEGKLCGEQTNTVHLNTGINSKNGQLTNIQLRKRNSRG
tara:strand:+ start:175 stop:435 length:261 start_codon:yes stop_codon:yes gene_type:complete